MTAINKIMGGYARNGALPSFKLKRDDFITRISHHPVLSEAEKERLILRYDMQAQDALHAKQAALKRKDAWHDLITPLNYEINNVRSGIRYYQRFRADDPMLGPLTTYLTTLESWLRLFDAERTAMRSLDSLKAQLESQIGRPLPNDGKHWTDWVPPKTKRQIGKMFAAVPHRVKAKTREPFARMVPPRMRDKQNWQPDTEAQARDRETVREVLNPTGRNTSPQETKPEDLYPPGHPYWDDPGSGMG